MIRLRTLIRLGLLTSLTMPALSLAAPAPDTTIPRAVVDRGSYTAQNGQRFSFVKELVESRVVVTFTNGDLKLDRAGMRRYEAEHPAPTIQPELLARAEALSGETLHLIVWLDHQPAVPIARDLRKRYQAELDGLAAEVRDVQRTLRPPVAGSREEEAAWLSLGKASVGGLSQTDRAWLTDRAQRIEALHDTMRQEIADAVMEAVADDQASLEVLVTRLGGQVARQVPFANAATIHLPATSLLLLADAGHVARIQALPKATPELDLQKTSLGLDAAGGFWQDGFTGTTHDAGILDTGVQQDHPALSHLTFESMIGTTDTDGHGTAIAGIIASDDDDSGFGCSIDGIYCGMAWGMDTLLVGSSDALDVLADADWMVTTATEGPEAINLSAGYGTADDVDYSGFDAFFDALVDGAGVTVCTSAGDGGVGVSTTLTHPANAYNVVSVANMDDQNTTTRFDDVSAASSSRGPTLAGRKKPDLAAPGELTRTTDNDWETGPDFIDVSGTSASAPHCTGAALLLADQRGTADPIATKAVLINSATTWTDNGTPGDTSDDGNAVDSEWNSTYGWGYLDLREANRRALDVLVGTVGDGSGAEPRFRLYGGFLGNGDKATLVWNRHVDRAGAGEPSAIEDLTDLDLESYQTNSATPVPSSSMSLLDNVEQVPGVGIGNTFRVLKVVANGPIDPDVGTETFALATRPGWAEFDLPTLEVSALERPIAPGRTTRVVVEDAVTGLAVPRFQATLNLPAGYTLIDGSNPQTNDNIFRRFSWTVQAPCTTDAATADFALQGEAYGESLANTSPQILQPVIEDLTPDTFAEEQWVDRTFAFPIQAGRWSTTAFRSDSNAAIELWGDDDMCMGSPYQTSNALDSRLEMIVANGSTLGDAMHQTMVTYPDGDFESAPGYTIEHEKARTLPIDGSTLPAHFADTPEIIEVFQIPVIAGQWYEVHATAQPNVNRMSVAFLGYEATRDNGDIQNPNLRIDRFNAEGGDSVEFLFRAQTTGNFGLIVLNQFDLFGAEGTWQVGVRQGIFVDGFETGDTSNWSFSTP